MRAWKACLSFVFIYTQVSRAQDEYRGPFNNFCFEALSQVLYFYSMSYRKAWNQDFCLISIVFFIFLSIPSTPVLLWFFDTKIDFLKNAWVNNTFTRHKNQIMRRFTVQSLISCPHWVIFLPPVSKKVNSYGDFLTTLSKFLCGHHEQT